MTQSVWRVEHKWCQYPLFWQWHEESGQFNIKLCQYSLFWQWHKEWTVQHEAVSVFTILTMTCGAMLLGQVHNVLGHCQRSKWGSQVDRQQKQTHHRLFNPLPSIILPDWLWVYHSTSNFNPSLPDLTHTESLAVWVSVWDDPAFQSRGNVKMSMSITVTVRACFLIDFFLKLPKQAVCFTRPITLKFSRKHFNLIIGT